MARGGVLPVPEGAAHEPAFAGGEVEQADGGEQPAVWQGELDVVAFDAIGGGLIGEANAFRRGFVEGGIHAGEPLDDGGKLEEIAVGVGEPGDGGGGFGKGGDILHEGANAQLAGEHLGGNGDDRHQHGDDGKAAGRGVEVDVKAHDLRPVAADLAKQLSEAALLDGLAAIEGDLLGGVAHLGEGEAEIGFDLVLFDGDAGEAVTGKVGDDGLQHAQKMASQNM